MILGLDVGGTHTDAVIIDENGIVAETKTLTGDDLLETLRLSIKDTVSDIDTNLIQRLVFSTTMATNAIVQDRLEETGMIVSAGPGMDPDWFSVGPSFHVVEGCLDHQGLEAMPLNKNTVLRASDIIRNKGINVIGVAGKFSVRNPEHEKQIADWIGNSFNHIALGHHMSGALNFPRRIATTYLNAALFSIHRKFSESLISILDEQGLNAPRYLLKPDGGTAGLGLIRSFPAQTAQSGPAASVMGALALDGCHGTTLVLDVGGTTTDISAVLDGVPLLDPTGIKLGPYLTLVRSLNTYSIAIGGDSEVKIENNDLKIGPLRKGMPVAFGGTAPTPTDAMITLGILDAGNRDYAVKSMERLGGPAGWDGVKTAENIMDRMSGIIADAAKTFINDINSRPVYTIHEVIEDQKIEPSSVVVIGGPAPQIAPFIGKALGLPHRVPPSFGVVNAVGAAVARVTSEIILQADTERGTVMIPEAGIHEKIDQNFDMDSAIDMGRKALKTSAAEIGAGTDAIEISITEKQVFNMIRGYSRTGRNIRLKMCITPGIIPEWKRKA
ncbi:MAG TPA: hydantoinase/oxoprolinase family protein [Desulfobacteraceae bacterium]|nr:hydantoinase/oxoprolinase family protein [Desulfobacteraceae bacterium]HPJ68552.1 hydantoinase/oxoprolinase family protein [Desulfobacteraceae bacterium]HPQ28676.1 hydantoinase/oxoprolinase family protein [Desulfobacteraceae bacterium]